MVTTNYQDGIWKRVSKDTWNTYRGTHIIKLDEDGCFYSNYRDTKKLIDSEKNCLYFNIDFVNKCFSEVDEKEYKYLKKQDLFSYKLEVSANKLLSGRRYLIF